MKALRRTACSITLLLFFLALNCQDSSAKTIVYSEKFRIDTEQEASLITVPIMIKDADNVYAFRFNVNYTPKTIVSYNMTSNGPFLNNDDAALLSGDYMGLTKSGPGYISEIIYTRKGAQNGISGDGIIAYLHFNKISSGKADIMLSGLMLSGPNASQISNVDIYYLTLWDDSDLKARYTHEQVGFYATFEDSAHSPIITNSCYITVNGQTKRMSYDNSGYYKYSAQFNFAGKHRWSVTCNNTFASSDTALIFLQGCTDMDGDGKLGQSCGGTDCDDGNSSISPNAKEACDGKDNDCDGITDEGFSSTCTVDHSTGITAPATTKIEAKFANFTSSNNLPDTGKEDETATDNCSEHWVCGVWSACNNGLKSRACVDLNNCLTTVNMPITGIGCGEPAITDNYSNNYCIGGCQSNQVNNPIFLLASEPEHVREGVVRVLYNNSAQNRKSGVVFKMQVKGHDGKVLVEELVGPATIDENGIYEQEASMPFYLLTKDADYTLAGFAIEKGIQIAEYQTQIDVKGATMHMFYYRIIPALLAVAILATISGMFFVKIIKRRVK